MSIQVPGLRDERLAGAWPEAIALSAAGVGLVLALPEDRLPRVVHWGAALGSDAAADIAELVRHSTPPRATNGVDVDVNVSVVPESWSGWTGAPGLSGHRAGRSWSAKFVPTSIDVADAGGEGGFVVVHAADEVAELRLRLLIEMLPSGLVRLEAAVENAGIEPYVVDALSVAVPVPTRANSVLDFAGRWAKERVPQLRPFTVGAHVREGRHGRTGADAATVLIAGTDDMDFGHGEVWGVHVAFSGNHRVTAERLFSGERVLTAGELLLPGEIELSHGETYTAPPVFAVYGQGLDAAAGRFHNHLRARPKHPSTPRPVVMNVWEAVYFDHDLERLLALADLARDVGVERFVLDDGWFGSRRDDTSGLGDWVVSDEMWGDGRFADLVAGVKSRGMDFGLWFEPEMVNPDSDLARTHPEWLLQVPGRLPVEFRHQQVLDLTHPGAFAHVRDHIVALVHEYEIDYIKWDHNRDLIDAGSTRTGRAGVHEQTYAAYRLLDEIRAACPALEIESCSSGGARIDLGILEHTDRVWASDCIDARERQQIQRWTAQLVPPELVGSHVGADRAHTTGRRLDLSFRAATALFGSFGIEWDLTEASPAEVAQTAAWVAYFKRMRPLLHSGTTVRRSIEGGDLWLHGVVAADRTEALYSVVVRERPVTWPAGRVQLPGLDPDVHYRVTAGGPGPHPAYDPRVHPSWWEKGTVLAGASLAVVGVNVPALHADHAALLRVEAVR